MALKLKGSTSGFVAIDAPSVSGNNTLILPENSGSAQQLLGNDITAGVTTFTRVTVNRNGDLTVPGTISIGGTLTYEDVTSVDSVGIVTARGLSIFGNTTGLQVASGISTFQGVTGTTAAFSGEVDIADKIVHNGDTDTTIRFPSANTVSVETAGSERLRVDSGGDVGINISDPTAKLHIVEATSIPAIKIKQGLDSNQNSALTFFNDNDGGTLAIGVFGSSATTFGANEANDAFITANNQLSLNAQNNSGQIRFGVGSTPNTKMLLDSSGRLLIGTTTEGYADADNLTIKDSGNCGITIRSGTSNYGSVFFSDATSGSGEYDGFVQYDHINQKLTFGAGASGAPKLSINSSSNAQFTGIVTATEFIPTVSQFSHRNLVINGDFRIAQRGTSATTASAMSTVDRWTMLANGVDENPTQSQVDVASGTTPYSQGLRKAFRITNGNQTSIEAADFIGYKYVFEAQDIATSGWNYTSSSSFITLSFWIKTSVTNVSTANLRTYDSSPVRSFKFDISTTANTWKKVELKVPGNSNLVFDNNTGAGLVFHLYTYLGTTYRDNDTNTETWIDGSATNTYGNNNVTNTWWNQNDATVEITGVQLEVGSQATPFEHRSYQDELHRCKRYYQRYPEGPHADNYICVPSAVMVCNNTTTAYYCPTLNPTMRTSPSFSTSGNFRVNGTASVNNVAVTAIGVYHNGAATPFQYATVASGLTAGESIAMSVYNDANAYIAYDAEI